MNNRALIKFIIIFVLLTSSLGVFIFGCSGDSSGPTNPNPVISDTMTIGVNGGTLTTISGKVSLIIPKGALTQDTLITIQNTSSCPIDPGNVKGTYYKFLPEGLSFNLPVSVTIKYESKYVPDSVAENTLKLCKAVSGQWETVPGFIVVQDSNYVRAPLGGFSTYGVVGTKISGATYQGDYEINSLNDTLGIYGFAGISGNLMINGGAGDSIILPNLKWISGALQISANGSSLLKTVRCENLIFVDGQIAVSSAWGLKNLSFPKLCSIGGLTVFDSKSLKNLDGFSALRTINSTQSSSGDIDIQSNDSLVNLNGLAGIGGEVNSLILNWNKSLSSLTGLGGIGSIKGQCEITYCYQLTSLSGLNLINIGTNFLIKYNSRLASLSGLEKLRSIGGWLQIEDCYVLPHLTGLNALNWIGGGLSLIRNYGLATTSGLGHFSSLGSSLIIDDCSSLTDLSGFSSLKIIQGPFRIKNCDLLATLSGLDSLVQIGSELRIEYMDELVNLDALSNVRHIDLGITIDHNYNLESIAGLWNLQANSETGYVSTSVMITYNRQPFSPHGLGNDKAWEFIDKVGGILYFPEGQITIKYN